MHKQESSQDCRPHVPTRDRLPACRQDRLWSSSDQTCLLAPPETRTRLWGSRSSTILQTKPDSMRTNLASRPGTGFAFAQPHVGVSFLIPVQSRHRQALQTPDGLKCLLDLVCRQNLPPRQRTTSTKRRNALAHPH
jgi:hypothetical protein